MVIIYRMFLAFDITYTKKIKPSEPKALFAQFAHKNYLLAFDFKSAAPAAPHAARETAIAI